MMAMHAPDEETTPHAAAPALSVIVAVNPRAPSLPRGLEPFVAQTADAGAFELLLVDWEGGPSYLPLVEQARSRPDAPAITYLRCPRRRRAAQNNLGVSRARAPIIAFCGDDFIPPPGWVQAHLAYHARHADPARVAIGAGLSPQELRRKSPFLAWLEDSGELFGARFRAPSAQLPPGFFYVANASLKRGLMERAGSFDEVLPYPAGDDADYGARLLRHGMISELLPAAACVHEHLVMLADRRVQMGWAGTCAALLSSSGGRRERARRLANTYVASIGRWLRTASMDGPRVASWRLSLTAAYLAAYTKQMATPADR
jgi:hypothetical protein